MGRGVAQADAAKVQCMVVEWSWNDEAAGPESL